MKKGNWNYLSEIQRWGLDPQRLREDAEELLYALTTELNRLELQVGLATVCIRTPHPQLDMLVFRWRPLATEEVPTSSTRSIVGQKTTKRADGVQDIYYMVHGHTNEDMWKKSPFYQVIEEQSLLRIKLLPRPKTILFPIVEDLMSRGMTDYIVFSLPSDAHVSAALSISTYREGGFPDDFLNILESVVPLLALSVAYKVECIQFQEVLSAYIGTEPASLVLKGQIHRGDVFSREAALGFADIRGFTAAAERLLPTQLLDFVSSFFELIYTAVYNAGGEILKFMGDGVLFMFSNTDDPRQTCDRALQSVLSVMEAVGEHNKKKDTRSISFGCGLHYGTVLYGNIGSPARLDFTVMGPAVNRTSRLEGLTGKIGEVCLLSERFAELSTLPNQCVGEFTFKGLSDAQKVYKPTRKES